MYIQQPKHDKHLSFEVFASGKQADEHEYATLNINEEYIDRLEVD